MIYLVDMADLVDMAGLTARRMLGLSVASYNLYEAVSCLTSLRANASNHSVRIFGFWLVGPGVGPPKFARREDERVPQIRVGQLVEPRSSNTASMAENNVTSKRGAPIVAVSVAKSLNRFRVSTWGSA